MTACILRLELSADGCCRLSTGTAIEISGLWKACPPGKEQSHELQTTEVKIVGQAEPDVRCPDQMRSYEGRI
jgi:asparaginyl-tRNA synthetase